MFIIDVILLTGVAFPVAVAGVLSLIRNHALRPLGWTIVGTAVAYFALGGKSYYALPVMVFALSAGAIPRRNLPPVASADVTMRFWHPTVAGRRALVIGYARRGAGFCTGYRILGRISGANDSNERGEPIAACTLRRTLAELWPSIVAPHD